MLARHAVRASVTALAAHVYAEAYARLTANPGAGRLRPAQAGQVLDSLSFALLELPASAFVELVATLAAAGIPGGAIYDGIVAATAKHHGYRLLTLDHRAARTYGAVGVDYELIG